MVLHIFLKDVKRYWPYAAVLLGLRATAFLSLLSHRHGSATAHFFLVPLAAAALMAMVVHEDSLTDDDAFWLTRPYRRMSLLAAKGLFALVMIGLPVFASDLVWFSIDGVLSPEALGVALWRQVVLIGWMVLGAAAVASVTRGLGQFLFAGLATLLAVWFGALDMRSQTEWGAVAWIRGCLQLALFAGALLAVMLWQYRRRRLWPARVMLAGAVALFFAVQFLLSWRTAYAVQSVLAPAPATLRVALDPARDRTQIPLFLRTTGLGRVNIAIPVTVSGVSSGQELVPDGVKLCIETPGASAECPAWGSASGLQATPSGYWAWVSIDRALYRRMAGRPATLRVDLGLTLFAESPGMPPAACSDWVGGNLFCRSLDTSVRVLATHQMARGVLVEPYSYGPDPWFLEVVPYNSRMLFRISSPRRGPIITQRPTGHALRELTIPNTTLSAFAVQ